MFLTLCRRIKICHSAFGLPIAWMKVVELAQKPSHNQRVRREASQAAGPIKQPQQNDGIPDQRIANKDKEERQ